MLIRALASTLTVCWHTYAEARSELYAIYPHVLIIQM